MQKQKFDAIKAIEVLLFITQKVHDIYSALKVLYFADKDHLSKYGRFICGDYYVAMEHGPVPSNTYDIVKIAKGTYVFSVKEDIKSLFEIDGNNITPTRKSRTEYLSESDIECLNEAITKFGSKSFAELRKQSHDEAFKSTDYNDVISLEAIIKELPNAKELLKHYEFDN